MNVVEEKLHYYCYNGPYLCSFFSEEKEYLTNYFKVVVKWKNDMFTSEILVTSLLPHGHYQMHCE